MTHPVAARAILAILAGPAIAVGACELGSRSSPSVQQRSRVPVLEDRAVGSDTVVSEDRVALGARLFVDSTLSLDSTVSCATCHVPNRAFTEARPVSHGIGARARHRNTPSLINVAVNRSSFDWDGRARTLEDQLRGVFSVAGDMGMGIGDAIERVNSNASYDSLFRRAYGRPVDVRNFLAALVAFQFSLSVQSRFDRFYLGGDSTALTEQEQRGWRTFRDGARAGCRGCHNPIPDRERSTIMLFEDGQFHNLGVGYRDGRMEDVGRYGVTKRHEDWGAFRTPSLNNVALTAPYMHDGSIATLEEVIDFYANGGIPNPNLDPVIGRRVITKQERADLAAFLRSLTAEWLIDSAEVGRRLLRSQLQNSPHGGGR